MKRRLLVAFFAATLLSAVALSDFFYTADCYVSDALYQEASSPNPDILVVGIDQASLAVLGDLPWPRNYMAEAVQALNSDPDALPAVIGVDVLYTEQGSDLEADRLLVEAAAQYKNVVFASYISFDQALADGEDQVFSFAPQRAMYFKPFSALSEVSGSGLINAFPDSDGILRHALLSYEVSEEGELPSFSRIIYEYYCTAKGIPPVSPPEPAVSHTFYLPFTANSGAYCDGISFIDLLYGDFPKGFFRGKVVLIGPYARGLLDDSLTSLDHAVPMYGIDIHANAVEAFQKGFFPREVKPVPQLILMFVILFLSSLFFWKRRAVPSLIFWLSLSLGWAGLCKFCYHAGLIFHVLPIPLSLTALFLFSVLWNYTSTRREKHLIDETFGRYVDPEVKKKLLNDGINTLELGGKTTEIAVLFVDIRGFTTMSESLDAQDVVEILNRYLTLATECIRKNHGTLDKFVGDCAMAIWNAPVPQEDPVYNACHAALDMMAGSKSLNEELQSRFCRTVSFGVGINWGPAVVGNIGAPKRMDYTAIGDTVNTAARLESNAPANTIYISRSVADELGARAEVESLGSSIRLKGKSADFEILRLISLK